MIFLLSGNCLLLLFGGACRSLCVLMVCLSSLESKEDRPHLLQNLSRLLLAWLRRSFFWLTEWEMRLTFSFLFPLSLLSLDCLPAPECEKYKGIGFWMMGFHAAPQLGAGGRQRGDSALLAHLRPPAHGTRHSQACTPLSPSHHPCPSSAPDVAGRPSAQLQRRLQIGTQQFRVGWGHWNSHGPPSSWRRDD